ncbi:hypothetical protein SAMN06296273_0290 [Nitrosomonas ureae]|uniref:Uncharacterized protein n=1 Tax=Nitrosomonas ureae TaxID=44577 RepID=A0A285BU92_9PROT|nr:hypothetical protein [Nitrosomonas ureae]SNX58824.1 hypothetical protein SAMN06296273_0290 [Nitrosomonas ureae]
MSDHEYCTIEDAAEFLTSSSNKKRSKAYVIKLAKLGKIRLCIEFDGTLCKFFNDSNETITCIDDYKFWGYIQIPQTKIPSDCGKAQFTVVEIIQVLHVYHKNRDPLSIEGGAWLAKKKVNRC